MNLFNFRNAAQQTNSAEKALINGKMELQVPFAFPVRVTYGLFDTINL